MTDEIRAGTQDMRDILQKFIDMGLQTIFEVELQEFIGHFDEDKVLRADWLATWRKWCAKSFKIALEAKRLRKDAVVTQKSATKSLRQQHLEKKGQEADGTPS